MKKQTRNWLVGIVKESPAHAMFKGLEAGGKGLEDMVRRTVQCLWQEIEQGTGTFNEVPRKGQRNWVPEGTSVGLYGWLKEVVTLATTEGVYGEHNPYRKSRVRKAFWYVIFENGTLGIRLLINAGRMLPRSITLVPLFRLSCSASHLGFADVS